MIPQNMKARGMDKASKSKWDTGPKIVEASNDSLQI